MDLSSLKFDDLAFGTKKDAFSFGPDDVQPDFGAQFNGKLFKPYNKREKLGKMVEFSMIQAAGQVN